MSLCALLLSTLVGAAESERTGHQNRLLRDAQVTRPTMPADNLPPIEQLQRELVHLWDIGSIGSQPLEPQVVYSESNKSGYPGYKIEGVYLNGAQGDAGIDRIFFYYSRPTNATGNPLTQEQIEYIVAVLERWLSSRVSPSRP